MAVVCRANPDYTYFLYKATTTVYQLGTLGFTGCKALLGASFPTMTTDHTTNAAQAEGHAIFSRYVPWLRNELDFRKVGFPSSESCDGAWLSIDPLHSLTEPTNRIMCFILEPTMREASPEVCASLRRMREPVMVREPVMGREIMQALTAPAESTLRARMQEARVAEVVLVLMVDAARARPQSRRASFFSHLDRVSRGAYPGNRPSKSEEPAEVVKAINSSLFLFGEATCWYFFNS